MLEFLKTNLNGSFNQWSADNFDHNVCTVDGKSTLHGMGIVVFTTPGRQAQGLAPTPRQKEELRKSLSREKKFLLFSTTYGMHLIFHHVSTAHDHSGKAEISMILIIHLNPIGMNCIYLSTLRLKLLHLLQHSTNHCV